PFIPLAETAEGVKHLDFSAADLQRIGRDNADSGRGATIRLWQLKIPLGTVKLFITHLHSDHTVGIPDLWLTGIAPLPYGRRNLPFAVEGPKGTAEMMSYVEKAYHADIDNRREFIPNFSPQQVAITAKDIEEGVVYDQNGVRVTAFNVRHANLKDAFGFRVDYRDTRW